MTNHTEVEVTKDNRCDFCGKEAAYDAKTRMGMWAWMCPYHFRRYGMGLGLGLGQRLVRASSDHGQDVREEGGS